MSHTDTPWVPIETAAQHYSVSPDTIRRMITRGEIEGRRFGPRLIRVQIPAILTAARPLQYIGGDAE
ncbi:hypothetical protein RSA3_12280 [Microbacterium testaceum]|uniref:Helix-turn-helix domain-containing protein n=1 Tax=Microbacterium testaceum TaxID=2033 RepID=A0A147F5U7_MICTE|nr:hypothetical protein RSA3_12280 [Microbacterium testaceum]